jgi:hypothetical protein
LKATQSEVDAHDTAPRLPGSDAGAPVAHTAPPSTETIVAPKLTPTQVSEPRTHDTDSRIEVPAGTLSALHVVPPLDVDKICGARPVVWPSAVHAVVETQEIATNDPTEAGTDWTVQVLPALLVA